MDISLVLLCLIVVWIDIVLRTPYEIELMKQRMTKLEMMLYQLNRSSNPMDGKNKRKMYGLYTSI